MHDLCFSIPLWWELSPGVSMVVQFRGQQQQKVGDEMGATSSVVVRVGWEAHSLEKVDGCVSFS